MCWSSAGESWHGKKNNREKTLLHQLFPNSNINFALFAFLEKSWKNLANVN